MRNPIPLIAALAFIPAAAHAQGSTYYAERGYWTVYSGAKFCRALNRPPEDFNFAPYNALQIAVDAKGGIAVEVSFWPGAVVADRAYTVKLIFPTRKEPIVLPAKAVMDLMLVSDPDPALWRAIQDANAIDVRVDGQEGMALHFALNDSMWVLNALTTCQRVLPKA